MPDATIRLHPVPEANVAVPTVKVTTALACPLFAEVDVTVEVPHPFVVTVIAEGPAVIDGSTSVI
jgi:hypothetical protein